MRDLDCGFSEGWIDTGRLPFQNRGCAAERMQNVRLYLPICVTSTVGVSGDHGFLRLYAISRSCTPPSGIQCHLQRLFQAAVHFR